MLDLLAIDPELPIAPNFVLSEIASSVKGRYGRSMPVSSLDTPVDASLMWEGDEIIAIASGFDEGEPLRIWRALDASGREICRPSSMSRRAMASRWRPCRARCATGSIGSKRRPTASR